MIKGLIGKKVEMTQVFDRNGRVVPATKIKVTPNFIIQVKQAEKDGYKAVQIGAGVAKKPTKPLASRAKRAGLEAVPKIFREVEFDGDTKIGQKISLGEVFRKGSLVDVRGISKGKGFAGVVKRWGFAGGPRTHGQSDRERAPGSIGATTTPGRVYKGTKMAGHMGNCRVTTRGLEVMEMKEEENELWVKGSVPGARNSILLIQKSKKEKKAYHEPDIPAIPVVAGAKEEAPQEPAATPLEPSVPQKNKKNRKEKREKRR